MVFISLGTQKQQFPRILSLVENSKVLKDCEIVAQIGNTKYNSNKIKCFDFMEQDEFEKFMSKSDLVICHGGVGTIFTALKKEKKILAIPRLKKYKEHINDHQIEVCNNLQEMGYIECYKDGEDFDIVVKKILEKKYEKYISDYSYIDKIRKQI
ncbi:MAG: PssE/Cps14G family polysaccharide biosynthesis glycosyltransferase [Clostridia bacterium]